MFIAIDGASRNLPEDVRTFKRVPVAAAGADYGEVHALDGGAEAAKSAPKDAHALDRWDVQTHQYKTSAAVEASILARLISGKGSASRFGVVQEAKRFCVETTSDGRRVEHGTAVRLSVAVIKADFDLALTLPNIAAKAQISGLEARISLSVDGYVGPLGELLPAPDNLNVENLGAYTEAFKAIQHLVFGTDGLPYISPALLGYEAGEDFDDKG